MKRVLCIILILSLVWASRVEMASQIEIGSSMPGELIISPQKSLCVESVDVDADAGINVIGHNAAIGRCICVEDECEDEYHEGIYRSLLAIYAESHTLPGEKSVRFSIAFDDGSRKEIIGEFLAVKGETVVEEEVELPEIKMTETIINQSWEMLQTLKVEIKSLQRHLERLEQRGVWVEKEDKVLDDLEISYGELEEVYREASAAFEMGDYSTARRLALSVQGEHYIYLSRIDGVRGDVEKNLARRNDALESIKNVNDFSDNVIFKISECRLIGGCPGLRESADSLEEQLNQSVRSIEKGEFSRAIEITKATEVGSWNLLIKAEEGIENRFSEVEELIIGEMIDVDQKGGKVGMSAPALAMLTNTSRLRFEDRLNAVCDAIETVEKTIETTNRSLTSYERRKEIISSDLKQVVEKGAFAVKKANENHIEVDISQCQRGLEESLKLLEERKLFQAESAVIEAQRACQKLDSDVDGRIEREKKLREISFAKRLDYLFERLKRRLGLTEKIDQSLSFDYVLFEEIRDEDVGAVVMNPSLSQFLEGPCQFRFPTVRTLRVDLPRSIEEFDYVMIGVDMGIEKVQYRQ